MKGVEQTIYKNGTEYTGGNIMLFINGRRVTGVSSIEYSQTQTKNKLYGLGRLPNAKTYGRIEATASITFYSKGMEELRIAAREAGVDSILGLSDIHVIISYTPTEGQGAGWVDEMESVEFLNDGSSISGDSEAIETSVELFVPYIKFGETLS